MPKAKVSLDESVNKFLEESHKDWDARPKPPFEAPGGIGTFHNFTLPSDHEKRAFELLGLAWA